MGKRNVRPCSIEGCDKLTGVPGTARGYCTKHYQRWQKFGDPLKIESPRNLSPLEKFEFWTTRGAGCWLWNGSLDGCGYGTLVVEGHKTPAHRFSYERFIGPIPNDHQVHHTCKVRNCVNPAHLQVLTVAEHQRFHADEVTHCPRGHEYTPENTWLYRGSRYCRECRRTESRERKRRIREATRAVL